MKFDAEMMIKFKRASVMLVGAAVLGSGGYWYGSSSATPKMVAVSQTGCGTAATSGTFSVPLETIKRGAPKITASYGPMEIPAESLVQFKFDPNADGKLREISLVGDALHLPVTFGSGGAVPERIRVNCRDGAIATIRYESGSRSQTFSVVRQNISMLNLGN